MFRTVSRSAAWSIRHRCCPVMSTRLTVADLAVACRSKRGRAHLESMSVVGSMVSTEHRFRSAMVALTSSSHLTRPTRVTCSEHSVAAIRLAEAVES